MGQPSAQEVLNWALINRARLDPTGEAARFGITLNEGLAAGTISAASKQVVAFSEVLETAANAHSQAMIDADFFAHNNPGTGSTPQSRANAAGYSGGVGENIVWSGSTGAINATTMAIAHHQALFVDANYAGRGHRLNILDDRYQHVGVGQVLGAYTYNGTTYNASMMTQDFGIPSASGQFLTGIAYNDTDANAFYSVGEGRSGITVSGGTGGSTTTGTAGAYTRSIGSGSQSLTFSGGDLGSALTVTANVTAGKNALINVVGQAAVETSVSLTAVSGVTKIVGLGNLGLTLTGAGTNDTIVSALGNDSLNGAGGFDTAVFSGNRASYTITNNGATVTVSGLDGNDTLTGIEALKFADQTVNLGSSNTAPVAAIGNQSLSVNQWSTVSGWISYSDAEGNAATQYQFWDGGAGATSGYFWTPGNDHHAANAAITVNAADLGNVWVRGGQSGGSETMYVRAFDGTSWGEWDAFTLTTTAPKPVATIENHTVQNNEWSTVSSWINYSGGAATKYEFWDSGTAANSGYFWTPGNAHHAANTTISVNAADLGNVWVRGGQVDGSETLWVRAFDGTQWSDWDSFAFTTDAHPMATVENHSLATNQWTTVASWVNYTGDPATHFQFWDGGSAANSAYFWTPSNSHHSANTAITVAAGDLDEVWLRGGQTGGSETMWVRAYDGTEWSAWDQFTMTTFVA